MTPAEGKLIVRRKPEAEMSEGGIIYPDRAKEKTQEGIVVAVGPSIRTSSLDIPSRYKTGDQIIFGKYAGIELKIGGEELLIINESEVLVKL